MTTEGVVPCAETETGEFVGAKRSDDGFEAIIATGRAFGAVASGAKIEVKIVTNDQNIRGGDFVIIHKGLDGSTGFIVVVLGFHEDKIACTAPDSPKARFVMPIKVVELKIKIKGQKAKIMPSKIILIARIAEPDD